MTIHYVANSLRPTEELNQVNERTYLKLELWADGPPLERVSIRYKFSNTYDGPYSITQGERREVTVTGTQANPETTETWLVISGPEPPPAKLDIFAVIEQGGVQRRGGVTLLMRGKGGQA